MSRSLRRLVLILTILLPQRLKLAALRRIPGWTIGDQVYIGLSFLDAENVQISDGAYLGHFNLIRNVHILRIGCNSHIMNFNSFFGANALVRFGFESRIEMGDGVMFMSHHFIDCAGSLHIGSNVTVGGRSTEIYTHQRNLHDGVPVLEPTTVRIGRGTYVGARCTLVSCIVPPETVIGAGAVVVDDHSNDAAHGPVLLAGNPARVRKRYMEHG